MIRIILLMTVALVGTAFQANGESPVGTWRGRWSSTTTGHQGPMRARVRQVDHDTYRALFVGRFAGVIPFAYPAKLQRVPGSCDCYQSQQRLPLLGEYHMTTTISGHQFQARYRGRKDHGRFDLSR